jgi:Xaa-Pro aminopeptidase
VARAQQAAIDRIEAWVRGTAPAPGHREPDTIARAVIDAAGSWPAYGHGLGHGIGLATHEEPRMGRTASDEPLPSPTVFSVEPGVYVEGETGVRIEDLVHVDAAQGVIERLTRFPSGVVVLPV